MMSVSVIIPARNRAALLPHVLDSLSHQTHPASQLEVVVVDDGSTDDTRGVLQHPRWSFQLVHVEVPRRADPEFCPARPRNLGLHAATGDLAIFLDADVLALPEFVAEHVAAYEGTNRIQAVIGYTYAYGWAAGDRLPEAVNPPAAECIARDLPRLLAEDERRWLDGREPIYAETRDLADHPSPWQMYWTNNVSVPRALALEIGGFDEEFVGRGFEDLEFAYRLYQRGAAFRLARGARGIHYPHPIPELSELIPHFRVNRRRLLRKHANVRLELSLWNGRNSDAESQQTETLAQLVTRWKVGHDASGGKRQQDDGHSGRWRPSTGTAPVMRRA